MPTKTLILLALFSLSLAHAHPVHLSNEDINHQHLKSQSFIPPNIEFHHDGRTDQHHKTVMPCKKAQHKKEPCKKK